MSFFTNLFGGNQSLKKCPRCLGKGHVDLDDIKRLNRELKWAPGTCAYCNGRGKVDSKIEDNVPVDAAYLVMNLDEEERDKIIDGNPEALERGKQYEARVEGFLNQICYLHFEAGLNSTRIAEFFLIGKEDLDSYEHEKREFVDYVEKLIQKKAKNN